MLAIALIAYAICFLILPPTVNSEEENCGYGFLILTRVNETSSTNIGGIAAIKCREPKPTSVVGSHNMTDYYLMVQAGDGWYGIGLAKPIIVDFVRDVQRTSSGELTVMINVHCKCLIPTISRTFNYQYYYVIIPVDNYPLEMRPNALNVTEDTPIGSKVSNISSIFIDRDYPDRTRIISFSKQPSPSSQNDGFGIFDISSLGDITLSKALDYDKGIKTYQLKMSATNNISQTASGTVTVNVINVNDNPVRFVYRNCTSDCVYVLRPSQANQDPQIRAVDADNDPIEYSINLVIPASEADIMTINKTTGKLRQLQYPHNPNLRTVTLIIKAQVNSLLPPARDTEETSMDEDYARVTVNFETLRRSVSGGDQILAGDLHVPVCLIMMYGITKRVI